jgi:adenylate cyclase
MDRGQTLAAMDEARRLFERALSLDPNHVAALLTLAVLQDNRYAVDPHPDHDRIVREMDQLTARAVALDPSDPYVWDGRTLALVYLGRWHAAFDAIDKAIELDPYSPGFHTEKAWLTIVTGQPEQAFQHIDRAVALEPTNLANVTRMSCQANLLLGRPEQAIMACEKTTALDPGQWVAHFFLIAAYANAGDLERAQAARRAVEQVAPGYTIDRLRRYRYSEHPGYLKLVEAYWYTGLRKAGVPEK